MSAYHSERSTWLYLYWYSEEGTSGIQSLHIEESPSHRKGPGLSYHQLVTHIPLTYNIGNIWSRLFTYTIMTSLTIPRSILREKKTTIIHLGTTLKQPKNLYICVLLILETCWNRNDLYDFWSLKLNTD